MEEKVSVGIDVATNGDATMVRTMVGGDGTINIVATDRWTAEEIYEMSKKIALKMSTPLLSKFPREPVKGIVHKWDIMWPFGTVLDYRGQGLPVMYITKGSMLNLRYLTIDKIKEGTLISDWVVIEEAF